MMHLSGIRMAFIIPSNKPSVLEGFIDSMVHIPRLREVCDFILVYQEPVELTREIRNAFAKSIQIDAFVKSKPLPMLQLRRYGLQLAKEYDYICYGDDDYRFMPYRYGKNLPMSSDEYYLSSLDYMDQNPDVGVLSQRDYFGGNAWGYEIKKNPKNGLIENSSGGILLRNIGADIIFPRECWDFVGVMSEPLCGFNIMAEGYSLAKRFNCPNRFTRPGASKHVETGTNISYSEEVANENAQGYIRRKFNDPTWRHSSKKYPKGLPKC